MTHLYIHKRRIGGFHGQEAMYTLYCTGAKVVGDDRDVYNKERSFVTSWTMATCKACLTKKRDKMKKDLQALNSRISSGVLNRTKAGEE